VQKNNFLNHNFLFFQILSVCKINLTFGAAKIRLQIKPPMSYKIIIDETEINLTADQAQSLDLIKTKEDTFHLLQDNRSFAINLLHKNTADKTLTVEVNGNKYEVRIEDEYDQLVKKMGLSVGGAQVMKNIKAPMPGLILDILIKPGQSVEKGDQLLILEAMKMENVLKAEGDGVIKSIEVQKGNAVEKGQILIEME
jgi:biotin carboxyl carrier protein